VDTPGSVDTPGVVDTPGSSVQCCAQTEQIVYMLPRNFELHYIFTIKVKTLVTPSNNQLSYTHQVEMH